jgi:NADPH-dependent ferric siderophore reductase
MPTVPGVQFGLLDAVGVPYRFVRTSGVFDSHTESFAPEVVRKDARVTSIRRTPLHAVVVTGVVTLTPRLRRITVRGPSLIGLAVTPAQDVEVVLPDGMGHKVKRRYTIRYARPEVGEVDIDALIHPHGPGGRWAGAVAAGDEIEFYGPRGHLELRPAQWHLFIGDEAGLPAIAALVEALGALGSSATVLAEVTGTTDEIDELNRGPATVTWLHRGDQAPGEATRFVDALVALAPRADGRAYLLGESRAMVALRPALGALGLTADRSYVKGYWNRGRLNRPQSTP